MTKSKSTLFSFLNRNEKDSKERSSITDKKLTKASEEYLTQANSPLSDKKANGKYGYKAYKGPNPFYQYASSYVGDKPEIDKAKKRWEDVATINALSNVISAVGKGISAANGVKTKPLSNDIIDKSIKYIDKYDSLLRDDTRHYNDMMTRVALQGERRSDRASENYIKSLEKERDINSRTTTQATRDKTHALEQQNRQEFISTEKSADREAKKLKDDMLFSLKSKTQQQKVKADKTSPQVKPKVVTFIKDENQNSVPIYEDDMTQLYRIADYNGYLESYRNEKSDAAKRHQLNVAMQKAYMLYKKENKEETKGVSYNPKYYFK